MPLFVCDERLVGEARWRRALLVPLAVAEPGLGFIFFSHAHMRRCTPHVRLLLSCCARSGSTVVRSALVRSPALSPTTWPVGVPEGIVLPTPPAIDVIPCAGSVVDYVLAHKTDRERAFAVSDVSAVRSQYARWVRELPRVVPYYAVKCNNDPILVSTLVSLGASFDCASVAEIEQVMALGVLQDRIILANPCKPVHCLRRTRELGVHRMTFDNVDELEKIATVFGLDAGLVLRITVDDSKSMMRFGTKFGASLAGARALLQRAAELHLNVIGVSFHVGSGCQDPSAYNDAILRAKSVFEAAREYGFELSLLDIGGGFPGTLATDAPLPAGRQVTSHRRNSSANASLTFEPIAAAVRTALELHFPPSSGVMIIGEPGRYFAQSFTSIFVTVFARRVEQVDESALNKDDVERADALFEDAYLRSHAAVVQRSHAARYMYYVDDGIYQSFNSIMFDHAEPLPIPLSFFTPSHPTASADLSKSVSAFRSTLFGPTCDSIDCIGKDVWMEEMRLGDTLVYFDAGAYTRAAASNFNGMSAAASLYVESHAVHA